MTLAFPRLLALCLALSTLTRLLFVHLVDSSGGVQAIALRLRPGWSLEEHLASELFRARGYVVLVRGNENGVFGEGLLESNGYAFWLLAVALLSTLVVARRSADSR